MIGSIDIGGTKTLVGLVDRGKVVVHERFATVTESWQEHFEQASLRLEKLCERAGWQTDSLDGIGVSLPGMVNESRGVLLLAPYAGWKNVPARDFFRRRLKNTNVFVENDVNACAVGEWTLGHAKGVQDFLWVTVSTGVGGAVMANGRLVHGAAQVAGEIGHVKVEFAAPRPCTCGQEGCLEAHASGTAISRAFAQYIEKTPKAAQRCAALQLPIDARGCRMLADDGDAGAACILGDAARWLGRGLSAALNLLNPEAVFIGGGVGQSLDVLLPGIREVIAQEVVTPARSVPILYTKLGYNAAFLGAACLPEYERRKQHDF